MSAARAVLSVVAFAAAVVVMGTHGADAAWIKIYETDWSNGADGWSVAQSYLPDKHSPTGLFIGHPLAPYALLFNGQDGWGIRTGGFDAAGGMKIVTRVYMMGSQRNALSVNVRNRTGGLIFKYGMGGSNRVIANCQGAADQPVDLPRLVYQLDYPYDLMSQYNGSGYIVGLGDPLTGQEVWSPRFNNLKGGGAPACLDIDQEGGYGPGMLGRVEVWLNR